MYGYCGSSFIGIGISEIFMEIKLSIIFSLCVCAMKLIVMSVALFLAIVSKRWRKAEMPCIVSLTSF